MKGYPSVYTWKLQRNNCSPESSLSLPCRHLSNGCVGFCLGRVQCDVYFLEWGRSVAHPFLYGTLENLMFRWDVAALVLLEYCMWAAYSTRDVFCVAIQNVAFCTDSITVERVRVRLGWMCHGFSCVYRVKASTGTVYPGARNNLDWPPVYRKGCCARAIPTHGHSLNIPSRQEGVVLRAPECDCHPKTRAEFMCLTFGDVCRLFIFLFSCIFSEVLILWFHTFESKV